MGSKRFVWALALFLGCLIRGGAQAPRSSEQPPATSPSTAEILSDMQGVDFTKYLRRLRADLYRNWTLLIPEKVKPPLSTKGDVSVRFSILPDGTLAEMNLEKSAGDAELDKAALGAITSEGKFPPLPQEYHGPKLILRLHFSYNPLKDQPSPAPPQPAR